MNGIILLLLLGGCGGWRNDCCQSDRGMSLPGRGNRTDGCGCQTEGPGRRSGRDSVRPESCGCEEERPRRDAESCGCTGDGKADYNGVGLIPPPWQENPRFSRRDNVEDCES